MKYVIIAALLILAFILGSCAKQPTINGEPVELIHTDSPIAYT